MNEANNEDLTLKNEQTYTRRRRTDRYDEPASAPDNNFIRHASSYSIDDPEPDPYTRRQVAGSYARRPSASRYQQENSAAQRSQSAYSHGAYPQSGYPQNDYSQSGYPQRYPEDPDYIGQGSFSRPAVPSQGRYFGDRNDGPVGSRPARPQQAPMQRGSASRVQDAARRPAEKRPMPEKAHPILHLFVVLFLLAGCAAICFHLIPEGKLTWVDDAREAVTGFVLSFLAPEGNTDPVEANGLTAPEAVAFPETKPVVTAMPLPQPTPETDIEIEFLPIDDSGLPPEING